MSIKRTFCPDCGRDLAFVTTQTTEGGWFVEVKCDCGFTWRSSDVCERPIKAAIKAYEEWEDA